jgi:Carboxypeptidase regulatory-like domain
MKSLPGSHIFFAAVMWFGCAQFAFSQSTAALAQLNGSVEDESGGVVAKASIALREMDTNRVYTTTSNEAGFYVFPNIPPGRYELKVVYAGFANFTHTGVALSVGQTATVNVVLKVAGVGGEITVSGEARPIEPTRTEISQVVERRQIESLPISGRLFTDFALLTPAVAAGRTSLQSTFTEFEVTRVSFGGMRDLSNIVTVDGADNINTVTASQRAAPSQEAVSEFRVAGYSPSVHCEFCRQRSGKNDSSEFRVERHRQRAIRPPVHHIRGIRRQQRYESGDGPRRTIG